MEKGNYYAVVAAELAANETEPALWTQAFAEANGEPEKTKALYIRLRVASLQKSAAVAPTPAGDGNTASAENDKAAAPLSNEVRQVRSALARELRAQGKSSFYAVLELTPLADDATLAAAIATREEKIRAGEAEASPEFNYAKETLGTPSARDRYDRRLLEQLSTVSSPPEQPGGRGPTVVDAGGSFFPWWMSRKTSVIIGVLAVALVAYMGLAFFKERGAQDGRKEANNIRREAVRAAATNEGAKIVNERAAIEGQVTLAEKVVDRAAEIQNRAIAVSERAEDRRRQELEYRANASRQLAERQREEQLQRTAMQQERLQIEKQRAEEAAARRQRQYWTCMNGALDRMNEAAAQSRCAAYR